MSKFKSHVAQKGPYHSDEEAGACRSWCTCGLAETQPFCDGSHFDEGTGLCPLNVTCEKKGEYLWCGCKQTKTPPYCDGSHNKL